MGLYFNFRIVPNKDGTETIDEKRITPWNALTPVQQDEYKQVENSLYYIHRQKEKEARKAREAELKQNIVYNICRFFCKVACACGMI